jgi:LmbE family N-acetylglucosaminyl deacetylase
MKGNVRRGYRYSSPVTRHPSHTALAIAAHPDDIEFMMAGTLILLKRRGWDIHYLNLCNGCCGTTKDNAQETAARRRLEAQNACRAIGAQFHESIVDDLALYHTHDTIARAVAVVRQVRPRIVLTHSPSDYMEDHMNACRVAVTAAFARGMAAFHSLPELPPIASDVTVYHALPYGLRDALRQRLRAGQYVDVGAVLKLKRKMLAAHRSQKEWLDASQGLNAYLDSMEVLSREIGRLSGVYDYAEGWRRHLHLGFSAKDSDPLGAALGRLCVVDEEYERGLERAE